MDEKEGSFTDLIEISKTLSFENNINNLKKMIIGGNIEALTFFVENYDTKYITNDDLYEIVKTGNLELINNLLMLINNFDISFNNDLLFRTACKYEYIDVATYLLEINPHINVSCRNDEAFLICCENCNINLLELLVEYNPNIKDSKYLNTELYITEHAFIISCNKGNIKLAKWLLNYDNNINISLLNEKPFERACYSGNKFMVQWLLNVKPDINIRIYNDEIFIISAHTGYTEICDILINKCKNILNYKNIDNIFKNACKKGKIDVIYWLLHMEEIKNFKYLNYNYYCEICILHKENKIIDLLFNHIKYINYYMLLKISAIVGNKEVVFKILDKRKEIIELLDYDFYLEVYEANNKNIEQYIDKDNHLSIKEYILDIKPDIKPCNCFWFL